MTEQKSGTRDSIGFLDIITHVPRLLADTPAILRGVITGFGARPSAKTSIGKVFQERAARHADKLFFKFGDEQITYREANETVTATPPCWPPAVLGTATSSASCCATRQTQCC